MQKQVQTSVNQTPYKSLGLFSLAACSLIYSGYLISSEKKLFEVFILLWATISGVHLIYRFNDFIDNQPSFTFSLKDFLKNKFHLFLLAQFIILGIPLSILILDKTKLIYLSFAAIIGTFYSLKFKIGAKSFRLKNIFLLKNILIGLVWGSLILIGNGKEFNQPVLLLFSFTSLQVMIGSIVRDVPDIEQDLTEKVNSLPVILGLKKTYWIMHLLNFSGLLFILENIEQYFMVLIILIIIYRFINILMLSFKPKSVFWSQRFNLFACVLIGIITFIHYLYLNV